MSELTKTYKEHCKKLELEANRSKRQFLSKLVSDHAFYEKGQIIDNGVIRIQVDSIKFAVQFGDVSIVYSGIEFTKKNTPKKSRVNGYIYTNESHKGIEVINDARRK